MPDQKSRSPHTCTWREYTSGEDEIKYAHLPDGTIIDVIPDDHEIDGDNGPGIIAVSSVEDEKSQ